MALALQKTTKLKQNANIQTCLQEELNTSLTFTDLTGSQTGAWSLLQLIHSSD